ncbi:MAG: hypothetical protein IJW15_05590 [Clostridia bacterium]|nr:hypothetical protein [Clostridia bacterium]
MLARKLRSRLFGFKKKDVYSFIEEMDAKAAEKLAEKDKEIQELRTKVAELEANRDAVVSVLQLAEKHAKEIVDDAKKTAETMRQDAEQEIQEKKGIVNREIEIKRKAIKTYYANENKKIDQIKGEVERMRRASLDAIQNFERQLREVERMTYNSSSYVSSAMDYAQSNVNLESFDDVDREIPVRIVSSLGD